MKHQRNLDPDGDRVRKNADMDRADEKNAAALAREIRKAKADFAGGRCFWMDGDRPVAPDLMFGGIAIKVSAELSPTAVFVHPKILDRLREEIARGSPYGTLEQQFPTEERGDV